MELVTETAEPADHAPNLADDNRKAPQRKRPPLAREGYDRTPEAMQITVHHEDEPNDVTYTTTLQELEVDDKMDDEGEVVRDGEELRRDRRRYRGGQKGGNYPAKQEGTGN
jgi:hypothetical protein